MRKRSDSLPLVQLFQSICSVAGAFMIGVLFKDLLDDELVVAILIGTIAAFCNWVVFRGSFPFLIFSFFVPIGIYTAVMVPGGEWISLTGFLILLFLHLPALWTHVPYYPTPKLVDTFLVDAVNNSVGDFMDIGCGTGRILNILGKKFPERKFFGDEISILPFLIAKISSFNRPNVEIRFKSFWKEDFAQYGIVYAFLSPAVMDRLGKKVSTELKSKSVFISNSFPIPTEYLGFLENRLFILGEQKGACLYKYQRK